MTETPGANAVSVTPSAPESNSRPAWVDDVEIKIAIEKKDIYFDILGIPEHVKTQLFPFDNRDVYDCESGLEIYLTQQYAFKQGPQFRKGNQLWLQRFGFLRDQWRTPCPKGYKLKDFRAKYSDTQIQEAFLTLGRKLVKKAIDYDLFIQENARIWKIKQTAVTKQKIQVVPLEKME